MSADLDPSHSSEAGCPDVDIVYVATNMAHHASWFELPELPHRYSWYLCFNTGDPSDQAFDSPVPLSQPGLLVGERSVVILRASLA